MQKTRPGIGVDPHLQASEKMNSSNGTFNVRSLREQLYEYIKAEIQSGRIIPGSYINLKEIIQQLGISKTPLRDALIQLECEGFVRIVPRRGVIVNELTIQDIKNAVEIVDALEAAVLLEVFEKIGESHLRKMEKLNEKLKSAIHNKDYDRIYHLDIAFHDVFIELSENEELKKIIAPYKQRLYDLPGRAYLEKWESLNCDEHRKLIETIRKGRKEEAVRLWRDIHWSYKVHEKKIERFSATANKTVEEKLEEHQ